MKNIIIAILKIFCGILLIGLIGFGFFLIRTGGCGNNYQIDSVDNNVYFQGDNNVVVKWFTRGESEYLCLHISDIEVSNPSQIRFIKWQECQKFMRFRIVDIKEDRGVASNRLYQMDIEIFVNVNKDAPLGTHTLFDITYPNNWGKIVKNTLKICIY
jgi:hypothetical protein